MAAGLLVREKPLFQRAAPMAIDRQMAHGLVQIRRRLAHALRHRALEQLDIGILHHVVSQLPCCLLYTSFFGNGGHRGLLVAGAGMDPLDLEGVLALVDEYREVEFGLSLIHI